MPKLAFISQDCRKNPTASGTYGIYEGKFPRGIAFRTGPTCAWEECSYTEQNLQLLKDQGFIEFKEICDLAAKDLGLTLPMHGVGEEVMEAMNRHHRRVQEIERYHHPKIYYTHDNPRILLENGSHIWGDECWWKEVKVKLEGEELAKLQAACDRRVEAFQQLLQQTLQDFEKEVKYE